MGVTPAAPRSPRSPGDRADADGPVDIFTGRPIRPRRPERPRRNPLRELSTRYRRRIVLLVAAVVVVVVASVVVGVATGRGREQTTPPAAIGPHDAPVASLPWGTVGPGWTALIWQTVQDIDAGYQRRGLYLVSPSGARYRVGDVLGGRVLDVSPDGRRILVSTGGQPASSVVEWDVARGTSHTIALAQGVSAPGVGTSAVRYTRPSADALLVSYTGAGTAGVVLERRGLDGILQQRFPSIPDAVTVGSDAATTGPDASTNGSALPVPTPDGRDLLLSTTTGMSLVDTQVGALVRRFPLPLGTASCSPRGWWAPGVARVRCDASGGGGLPGAPSVVGPVSDVWAFPVDGSPAKRLTTADGSMSVGFVDAWDTDIGTVAREGTRASDPCPASALQDVTPDGARTPVTFEGATTTPVFPLAVLDRTAYLLVGACGRPSALVVGDLAGGAAHALTGAGVDGGTVVSAVTIGRDD